ncbi:MAG: putative toxin-antitoxin system toxin component, PIN family [Rubrivivax sp.]|nr:putative toxin-antitoxin system toxin component, PIN family [Rubrivivax sp.]
MKVERVVIDTNVLISAALIRGSVPARLLRQVLEELRIVFSTATFAELESRLWRPKFDRYLTMEDRGLLLHDLSSVADWVEPAAASIHSRDPDDDKFVHLALASQARWLISGDRDLLDLPAMEGFLVLTPAEALRRLSASAQG